MNQRTWMIPFFSLVLACSVSAQTPSPDQRAFATEQKMTDDERFAMVFSLMGVNGVIQVRDPRIPAGAPMSASYVAGVPRLGVPALIMSDGSLGITNPGYRKDDTATVLPAGLVLGSSFNPKLAREADPRLIARFDASAGGWRIAEGSYSVALGNSAAAPLLTGAAALKPRLF